MQPKLTSNQCHIWVAHYDEFSASSLLNDSLHCLQPAERKRFERYTFDGHRFQYLAGQVFTRRVLSKYAEVLPQEWRFLIDDYGKPSINPQQSNKPLFFNLSHSGDYLVLAVSELIHTGIDVEKSSRQRRLEKIAKRHFSFAEVEALLKLPVQQQQQRFYELWTLKEAYIKARGQGLALSLQKFGFSFEADNALQFSVEPELEDCAENWQFWQLLAPQNYQLALAIKSDADTAVEELRSYKLNTGEEVESLGTQVIRSNRSWL